MMNFCCSENMTKQILSTRKTLNCRKARPLPEVRMATIRRVGPWAERYRGNRAGVNEGAAPQVKLGGASVMMSPLMSHQVSDDDELLVQYQGLDIVLSLVDVWVRPIKTGLSNPF